MITLEGKSPILWSIVYGSKELTETLILTGNDVDTVDKEGLSLIHNLLLIPDLKEESFLESLKLLIYHGADINYANNIDSPLGFFLKEMAKCKQDEDFNSCIEKRAKALIELGADIEVAKKEIRDLNIPVSSQLFLTP